MGNYPVTNPAVKMPKVSLESTTATMSSPTVLAISLPLLSPSSAQVPFPLLATRRPVLIKVLQPQNASGYGGSVPYQQQTFARCKRALRLAIPPPRSDTTGNSFG
nr:unnamed protein product [Leishmania braziliensis]CAJ2480092.1 unnamed protein product [Leishmania braziliensis]